MYEGLEKLAVTLEELRGATKALKKNVRLIRKRDIDYYFNRPTGRARRFMDKIRRTRKPEKELKATILFPKVRIPENAPIASFNRASIEQAAKTHNGKVDKAILNAYRRLLPHKKDAVILEGTEPSRVIRQWIGRPIKNPKAREMINRSALLHEGTEIKQGGKKLFPFFGHANVNPPLNDFNIMATLTGPGSKEAKKALYDMRVPELRYFQAAGLGRLGLGTHRVSRHAKPHIQQIVNNFEKQLYEKSHGVIIPPEI